MRNIRFLATFIFCLPFSGSAVSAGPFSDEMARCIVSSTNESDRISLVRWVVLAISKHPNVSTIVRTDPDIDLGVNKKMADIVSRLLADDCPKESRDAFRNEGEIAFEQAFQVLGKVAMRDLMANPDVVSAIEGFAELVDEERLAPIFQDQ